MLHRILSNINNNDDNYFQPYVAHVNVIVNFDGPQPYVADVIVIVDIMIRVINIPSLTSPMLLLLLIS